VNKATMGCKCRLQHGIRCMCGTILVLQQANRLMVLGAMLVGEHSTWFPPAVMNVLLHSQQSVDAVVPGNICIPYSPPS
jgi:hypothetical protein